MIVPLDITCRVCSHKWRGQVECQSSPIGLIAPDDIECPKCGSRSGDPAPESGSSFVGVPA